MHQGYLVCTVERVASCRVELAPKTSRRCFIMIYVEDGSDGLKVKAWTQKVSTRSTVCSLFRATRLTYDESSMIRDRRARLGQHKRRGGSFSMLCMIIIVIINNYFNTRTLFKRSIMTFLLVWHKLPSVSIETPYYLLALHVWNTFSWCWSALGHKIRLYKLCCLRIYTVYIFTVNVIDVFFPHFTQSMRRLLSIVFEWTVQSLTVTCK